MAKAGSGILFVLSGPSGVGKDALLAQLLTADPSALWVCGLQRCVTATTRAPRPGEVDGVDYHFWDVATFEARVQEDAFLEWARVYHHYYGTPRAWVDAQLAAGTDVVLKIDVQGGLTVKERRPDAVMIFLLPPSLSELERRAVERGTESRVQLETRKRDARAELREARHYDYLVVNDHLEAAVAQVGSVIVAERCRTARQATRWSELWEEIEGGNTSF